MYLDSARGAGVRDFATFFFATNFDLATFLDFGTFFPKDADFFALLADFFLGLAIVFSLIAIMDLVQKMQQGPYHDRRGLANPPMAIRMG